MAGIAGAAAICIAAAAAIGAYAAKKYCEFRHFGPRRGVQSQPAMACFAHFWIPASAGMISILLAAQFYRNRAGN